LNSIITILNTASHGIKYRLHSSSFFVIDKRNPYNMTKTGIKNLNLQYEVNMIRLGAFTKAFLLLLTINLSCFCPQIEAATVLAIEPMGTTESFKIAVAVDDNNNAVTVYDDINHLENSRYSPGNFLYEPSVVISDNIPFKGDGDVAMDGSSTALAIWAGNDGVSTNTIETNTLTGGVWGTPSILETSLLGNLVSPSVSMNGSGDGVAVWIDSNTNQVHASFYTGTWAPFQLVGTAGDAGNGSIVDYSTNGTAAVAWSHFDLGINDIFATTFNGLIWLPETQLDNSGNSFPDIGIDASDNAIAIWDGNFVQDVKWSRFDGVTWSIPQVLSLASGNGDPHIAVAPNGTAIAIWPDSTNTLQISQFNGTTWSVPVPVAPATDSAIAMDSAGNAIIGWSINDQLYVANLPLGGVLSEITLVTSGGLDIFQIDLALSLGTNTGVVGWREGGPEGGDTFATFVLFALPAPTPPLGITGSVCNNSFAMQSDRVHIISWDPSTDPLTVAYYIYRNGVLISIVPASGPFTFYDHNRKKGSPDTYTVYAVNAEGTLSTPVSITLN
jgi:hypothetical protein